MSEKQAKKGPVVVSILNLKGGVGKTTVAALLARYAASFLGKDVLTVDLDPQANLSQTLMGKSAYDEFYDGQEPSIVSLFDGHVPPSSANPSPAVPEPAQFVKPTQISGVEIIPSEFNFSDNLVKAVKSVNNEKTLANFISGAMAHKDLVVIDCAPTESIFTHVAYHASRYIVIPVKLEFFATIGLPLMAKSLKKFRGDNRAHKIDVCGILYNSPDTRYAAYNDEIEQAAQEVRNFAHDHGWPCFKKEIVYSRGYPKIIRSGYGGRGARANYEWREWTAEICKEIGLGRG